MIVRTADRATLDWLGTRAARAQAASRPGDGAAPPRVVLVREPGVVAAYNRGLDTATGDVVCFTDDDAAPHADWIERIERAFGEDAALGGMGGRDHRA